MNRLFCAIGVLLGVLPNAFALEPSEIAIIVNRGVPSSRKVAEHYAEKRGVPKENIIELSLSRGEEMSRNEYDRLFLGMFRDLLSPKKATIKCLLTTYGVPLRVGPKVPTDVEKSELETLAATIKKTEADLASAENPNTPDPISALAAKGELRRLTERRMILSGQESTAAVDSELMLLWWPTYNLARWMPNPLHWQFPPAQRAKQPMVLLTARLDGPTPEIAKRLVDDAIFAEENGLSGKAYLDARGIAFDPKAANDGGLGYGGYDQSFRDTATLLKTAKFDVILDDKPELFAIDSCPDACFYAGWYALGNYQRPGKLNRGAIAWHLASSEAVTLRDAKSKLWCPNLLKDGAAVTLGPVAEPYTIGFPKPAEFFGFVATGEFAMVEVHARTQYFTSWMTVFVGDPLYRPFAKTPRLKLDDVRPSPAGGRSMFR